MHYQDWDCRTTELLKEAYLDAVRGPGGSGSSGGAGEWRAKRQHLTVPMDRDGAWLDVGCANGHLLHTLPTWLRERDVAIQAFGLELIPELAALARSLNSGMEDRIWTGSVMTWQPPRRFRYVTVLDDCVPPGALGDLVDRAMSWCVEPGGRLIISSYTERDATPRALADDLVRSGHPPDGRIHIDRPGRHPLQTAWIDAS